MSTTEDRPPEAHEDFVAASYLELADRREEILHAYQERSSLRGLTRTFGVSRTTVSSWIKKK